MKNLLTLAMLSLVLSGCGPANPVQSDATSATYQTFTPSAMSQPTVTPSPTATTIPYPLTYVYQDDVPAAARALQEQAAYKAYASFSEYAELGEVSIYTFSDLDLYLDEIFPALKAEVPTMSEASFRMSWPGTGGTAAQNILIVNSAYPVWQNDGALCYKANNIAHEMFHMVQSELLQHTLYRPELDYGPEWLKEGSAQVMGLRIAEGLNGCDAERDVLQWWRQDSVNAVSLRSVEGGNFSTRPGFWGVAPLAVDYLIRIAPAGEESLMEYYSAVGAGTSWPEAFLNSFGMSRDEFYSRFENEVIAALPTVDPASGFAPTPTVPPGAAHLTGTVVLEEPGQTYEDYVISFCNLESAECLPGTLIDESGSFSKDLAPGEYRISVNPVDGGEALGWYVEDGLIGDINCATVFSVAKNENAALSINLRQGKCALAEGHIRVIGHVELADPTAKYTDIFVVFCMEEATECSPGVSLDSQGAFETGLLPGRYRVSINATNDGHILGWVVSNGLVPSITCAKFIRVSVSQKVDIPISIRPGTCPT